MKSSYKKVILFIRHIKHYFLFALEEHLDYFNGYEGNPLTEHKTNTNSEKLSCHKCFSSDVTTTLGFV